MPFDGAVESGGNMEDRHWSPGDRFRYIDKNGQPAYGTVTYIDGDKVYSTLDGYSPVVKGCFRSESNYVSKVVRKTKGKKSR